MIPPREVVSNDEYYMGLAFLVSSKSKDPNTQNGAIIVSADNQPIGTGYNGVPRAIKDKDVDWSRPNKYAYVHHAEDNAIWHADKKLLKGSTIYVTMHPCKNCMLDIVRAGIYKVVYFKNATAAMLNDEEIALSRKIAADGNVELVGYGSDCGSSFNWIEQFVKNMKDKNVIK